jgi:hypothetical protein
MTANNYRRTDVHAERKAAEREAAREAINALVNGQEQPKIRLQGKRILYTQEAAQ